MHISIICFSLTGYTTAEKIQKSLQQCGYTADLFKKVNIWKIPLQRIQQSGQDIISRQMTDLFLSVHVESQCAALPPYVASKKSDPAVLVVDECGKFVISLLSGHLGGANALALKTAEILGAEPVVTTATDLHDRFAVDVFAKNNHCAIFNMKAAKEVSAAILAGESVGFYSEFPWAGSLPRGLKVCTPEDSGKPEAGIAVTVHRACLPFTSTVQIVPKAVVLGLGCKKDKEAEIIRQEAEACLESESIYQEAVSQIASISLKKEEQGILALAADWNIPFCTFGEAELQNAKGTFEESEFVKKITGVGNVCERSAVLGAEQGRLIKKKTGRNGVTTALALRDWEVHFE